MTEPDGMTAPKCATTVIVQLLLLFACFWCWWPSLLGEVRYRRLKVLSDQVNLCWEYIIRESNLTNLPFLSQFDNCNFISKSQIQDLRASFHLSSPRPLAGNSHKSTFFKNLNHSDEQWQTIWKYLKFSVAGRKLPTLPGFVGNGWKIEAEHAQISMDTKIKAIIHFN